MDTPDVAELPKGEFEAEELHLREQVANAKKATISLVKRAIQNGAQRNSFSHIEAVYDPTFFKIVPMAMLPDH